MTRTMLWSLVAATIFAMAAGGAVAADAANKRNKATAGGQASSQGDGANHAWGSHRLVFPTTKSSVRKRRLQQQGRPIIDSDANESTGQ